MPSNNIAYVQNFTSILDEVYQRASVSGVLTSPRRMVRQGAHAREVMIPRIEVTGLGDLCEASHKFPRPICGSSEGRDNQKVKINAIIANSR